MIQHVTPPKGFETARARALVEDRKGVLWVGTSGAGVYSRDGGRMTVFNRQNGLSSNTVWEIDEDREGRIWVGTEAGIDVIDKGRVTSMQAMLGVSGPTMVRVIHHDLAGNMWVATDTHGLFLIDAHHVQRLGVKDGLPTEEVSAIYEDERGVIWLATTGGLAVWLDGRITSLAASGGALGQTILEVLEDRQHRIWLTSNKGLTSVPRADLDARARGQPVVLDVHSYDVSDGLRSAEFDGGNASAGCRTPDGRLWFPGIRGIVAVDPEHIRTNTLPPPVQIEQVIVDASPLDLIPGVRSPRPSPGNSITRR